MNVQEITWSLFKSCLGLTMFPLRDEIIVPSLCIFETDDEKKEMHLGLKKRGISQFINGKNKGKSEKILKKLARTTRSSESGCCYTSEDYPYLLKAKEVWEQFFSTNPDVRKTIEVLVSELCNVHYEIEFKCDGTMINLEDKLHSIVEGKDFFYQLSVLSIIAATWPLWKEASQGQDELTCRYLRQLTDMIFPKAADSGNMDTSADSEDSRLDNVNFLYQEALSLFQKEEYDSAGPIFVQIVNTYLTAAPSLLADSYDHLIKCCGHGYKKPSDIESIEDLKRWAVYYGSSAVQKRTHKIRQERKRAVSLEEGICIFNFENSISHWIKETMPANWKSFVTGTPASRLDFNLNNRFILINDNFETNIKDALTIFDEIKRSMEDSDFDVEDPGRIEIIIRCEQESVTALLDTACSFLDENNDETNPVFASNPIRIFLLDEAKRSADFLFAKHPLFYPFTFKRNMDKTGEQSYNLIILSDNHNFEYVSWLVREAFWLLPNGSKNIHSTITVLSPYALDIAREITAACPGFSRFSKVFHSTYGKGESLNTPYPINIKDISFPEIEYHTVSMNSRALQTKLENYSTSDGIFYYVVDSDSDFKAVSFASKIREVSIKTSVLRNEKSGRSISNYSSDSTIIAVRCSDPDYAGLAEDLIVPKETEREELWYNDYKLISFGSFNDLYSWDELIGGEIEFISECMHLQYCSNGKYDFSQAAPKKALRSYYNRLYNHESSFAAAMSLPYRLFEAGVFPSIWYIQNSDTFWAEKNRVQLAEQFDNLLKNDSTLKEKLSRWEHTRWCCYMLSNGWLPANPNQTYAFMNNGVTRHVLQIAKLHPCICSWDDLKELYLTLHDAYEGKQDVYGEYVHDARFEDFKEPNETYFQTLDHDNISQTGDILRARAISREKSSDSVD